MHEFCMHTVYHAAVVISYEVTKDQLTKDKMKVSATMSRAMKRTCTRALTANTMAEAEREVRLRMSTNVKKLPASS